MTSVRSVFNAAVKVLPYVAGAVVGVVLAPDMAGAATNLPIDAPTNTMFTSIQGYGGPLMKLGAIGVIGGLIAKNAYIWGGAAGTVGAGAALGGLDQLVTPFSPRGSQAMTITDIASSAGLF